MKIVHNFYEEVTTSGFARMIHKTLTLLTKNNQNYRFQKSMKKLTHGTHSSASSHAASLCSMVQLLLGASFQVLLLPE